MRGRWRSAILQGFGVLAGILAAFAIDAAWDRHVDAGREAAYLDALSAELSTNRARFESYRQRAEAALSADEEALQTVVFAPGPVSPESVAKVVAGFGALFLTLPERAALSDILTSGGIAYITDPTIRRLISRYSDALDQQLVAQNTVVELWRGRVASYFEAHASLYDMLGHEAWRGGRPLTPGVGTFGSDMEAFVHNRDFANVVTQHAILVNGARSYTMDLLTVMGELETALEGAP
jgi:hypothetical protein